jgi:hypothetical protein
LLWSKHGMMGASLSLFWTKQSCRSSTELWWFNRSH